MSCALPESERIPLDAYKTPSPLADAMAGLVRERYGDFGRIIEPSAGTGPFVRAARRIWTAAEIAAVDMDEKLDVESLKRDGANVVHIADWRWDWTWHAVTGKPPHPRTLVLGNPPYRQAEEHIRVAMQWMNHGDVLAFLLRLNFFGAKARIPFWRELPAEDFATIIPRPSFAKNKKGKKGSDGTEYAVFLWRKGFTGKTGVLEPLIWTPERAVRKAKVVVDNHGVLPGQTAIEDAIKEPTAA